MYNELVRGVLMSLVRECEATMIHHSYMAMTQRRGAAREHTCKKCVLI